MSQGPTSPFDSTFAPFVPKPPADGNWAAPPEANLRYMRSIEYVFENPQWLMNVIWILLCSIVAGIVPVLPQMVLIGYQFEVVEALLHSRGSFYPNFETNRISDYLTRGVWVFLASLLASIAIILALLTMIGLIFLAAFGLISALSEDAAPVIVPVMVITGAVIIIAAGIVANMVIVPIILRAGLSQDFGQAFDFAWVKDFIAKTWLSMIARGLFAMFAGMALLFVGLLACGVGYLVAIGVLQLMQCYLLFQLYAEYLSKGGTPVQLKPRMAPQMATAPGQFPQQ